MNTPGGFFIPINWVVKLKEEVTLEELRLEEGGVEEARLEEGGLEEGGLEEARLLPADVPLLKVGLLLLVEKFLTCRTHVYTPVPKFSVARAPVKFMPVSAIAGSLTHPHPEPCCIVAHVC
jgi:hypothetical protein